MSNEAGGLLVPAVLRELDLAPGAHPHGNRWLHATSALVCMGEHSYVVADDEHHLGHFCPGNPAPVELLPLFGGKLPRDKDERKRVKPDLESLALLPPLEPYKHGALLALGSGSRASRNRGALLALDATGAVAGPPQQLDLSALYAPLRAEFGALNIEGAFLTDTALHLIQRGNKGSRSARLSFDRMHFLHWLLGGSAEPPRVMRIQSLDLGLADGVPLTPTDAAALDGEHWLFCAVAEDTEDSYADGACLASLIGVADARGRIERTWHLRGNPKVEGIALAPGSERTVLLVTDADDPGQASRLLRCVF